MTGRQVVELERSTPPESPKPPLRLESLQIHLHFHRRVLILESRLSLREFFRRISANLHVACSGVRSHSFRSQLLRRLP
jgi:hypothetical protein